MLKFTVGPVISNPDIIEVANHSTSYFRILEVSGIEDEELYGDFLERNKKYICIDLFV